MCKKLLLFIILLKQYTGQIKSFRYLSHMRAAKDQVSLLMHVCEVSHDSAPISRVNKVVELVEGLDHKLGLQHSFIRQHGLLKRLDL